MPNAVDSVLNSLSLSSETKSLLILEKWINKLCETHSISSEKYGNILIAVTEAVNNAIIHGNLNVISKQTVVSYDISEKTLSFFIKDEGFGFDFNNLPDPTDPENIETPDGRGIFLMRHLSDDVVFHNEGSFVEILFNL
ncbi:MAG: ATP-binding protein [Flavobacteriales bacterium]|nr:ATP-binding protein [Flavobacteriales bacterium]